MTTEAGVLDGLATSFPPSVAYGHVALLKIYTASAYTFVSGDISANSISIATDYVVGTRVKITGLSDFDANTVFFVIQASPLKFAATLGGLEIPITTPANGSITDVEPFLNDEEGSVREIQTMEDLARYEISNYLGQNTRPVYTPPAGSIGTNNAGERAAILAFSDSSVSIDNIDGAPNNPSSLDLVVGGFSLIKDGSSTPGDTTGTLILTDHFVSATTVAAGTMTTLQFEISYPVYDKTQST